MSDPRKDDASAGKKAVANSAAATSLYREEFQRQANLGYGQGGTGYKKTESTK